MILSTDDCLSADCKRSTRSEWIRAARETPARRLIRATGVVRQERLGNDDLPDLKDMRYRLRITLRMADAWHP